MKKQLKQDLKNHALSDKSNEPHKVSASGSSELLCANDDCLVGSHSEGLGGDTILVYKKDRLVKSPDFYAFKYCPVCGNKVNLNT